MFFITQFVSFVVCCRGSGLPPFSYTYSWKSRKVPLPLFTVKPFSSIAKSSITIVKSSFTPVHWETLFFHRDRFLRHFPPETHFLPPCKVPLPLFTDGLLFFYLTEATFRRRPSAKVENPRKQPKTMTEKRYGVPKSICSCPPRRWGNRRLRKLASMLKDTFRWRPSGKVKDPRKHTPKPQPTKGPDF